MGFSAIEFATDFLGVTLFPWQRWLLIHALELHPEGGFRFRTVVVLVARQNGKSTLSQVLALWFMYVYGFNLVLGAAQDLDTAEEIWQGAVDLVTELDEDDVPVRPDLFEQYKRTVLVNGKKSLELETGARYKAKAANRRAGRGLSGDLVMLDELREHQTWDAWGAITKTTMARAEAQIWALSNAGDALSVVLAYLRLLAHAAIGDPDGLNAGDGAPAADLLAGEDDADDMEIDEDDDSLGIFEWSATPGCDIHDRDEWAQANPSLGYAITERTIAAAARTDPEAIFRTEVLCQWVETMTPSAIDLDLWKTRADPKAQRGADPVFAAATAPDWSWAAIAVAWRRPDGAAQVMVAAYKPEATWLDAEAKRLRREWGGRLLCDGASEGRVEDAEPQSEADQAAAEKALDDAVRDGTVWHGNQGELNTAVRGSRWRMSGNTKVLDRKGSIDITPVRAAAMALHGLDEDGGVQFW